MENTCNIKMHVFVGIEIYSWTNQLEQPPYLFYNCEVLYLKVRLRLYPSTVNWLLWLSRTDSSSHGHLL